MIKKLKGMDPFENLMKVTVFCHRKIYIGNGAFNSREPSLPKALLSKALWILHAF